MRQHRHWLSSFFGVAAIAFLYSTPTDLDEPFGVPTIVAPESQMSARWRRLQSDMRADAIIIAKCRAAPDACPSPAALQFIAIVDEARKQEGRAVISHINRAINLTIRAKNEENESIDERWSSPLVELAKGEGDCNTYAIIKYAALDDAGIAADVRRLVIVHDRSVAKDHIVVAVRSSGHWVILDNRRMAVAEPSGFLGYLPLFTLDDRGVRKFEPPNPKGAGVPFSSLLPQ
jgi:predicted transglutaminase-like cysteine proteinase